MLTPQIVTKRHQSAYSPSMHSMSYNKSKDSLLFAAASNTRQLSKSQTLESWKTKYIVHHHKLSKTNQSAFISKSNAIKPSKSLYQISAKDTFSFNDASNLNQKDIKIKSYQALLREKELWRKKYEAIQKENIVLKQQNNHKLIHDKKLRNNNYQILTPRNSDIYPSECTQISIIDIMNQIVSEQGIDSLHSYSCIYRKLKKLSIILPKLTLILNVIKKLVALFSTIFMLDCKLTGEGHFGIECIDQVRVISVDNSLYGNPCIYQNRIKVSIDELNSRQECLLPLCSCIHPATLRWHSNKTTKIIQQMFSRSM